MSCLIITNNPLVSERLPDLKVLRVEGSVLDLYTRVRDFIHKGHMLITHPLSGSLKPGKIPYKSVVLTGESQSLDLQSMQLIESSMEAYHKTFRDIHLDLAEEMLDDYAAVDLSHLEAALDGLNNRL